MKRRLKAPFVSIKVCAPFFMALAGSSIRAKTKKRGACLEAHVLERWWVLVQAMRVPGLTRENVASHLQKYRVQEKKSRGGGGRSGRLRPGQKRRCSQQPRDAASSLVSGTTRSEQVVGGKGGSSACSVHVPRSCGSSVQMLDDSMDCSVSRSSAHSLGNSSGYSGSEQLGGDDGAQLGDSHSYLMPGLACCSGAAAELLYTPTIIPMTP